MFSHSRPLLQNNILLDLPMIFGKLLTIFWFLELQIITFIAIVISSVVLEAMSQVRDEACETLQTEIHVTKGENTKTT